MSIQNCIFGRGAPHRETPANLVFAFTGLALLVKGVERESNVVQSAE
jgi:hypothetical protein